MDLVKQWGLLLTVGCVLAAQTVDDPVMKARTARAQAQGIEEADLPPVPRGVTEPPALPPPEIHAKDVPGAKVAKPTRSHGGKLRPGKLRPGKPRKGAAVAPAPDPTPKVKAAKRARPAGKAVRRSGKRGKA